MSLIFENYQIYDFDKKYIEYLRIRRSDFLRALISCALIVLRSIQRKHLINLQSGFYTLLEYLSNLTQNLLGLEDIPNENRNVQADSENDHLKVTIYNHEVLENLKFGFCKFL